MPRFLILADGDFGPMTSKTANSVIRYLPDGVVAVLDRSQAGKTVQAVLGFGGSTPVVGSMQEGLRHQPDAVLIGIAPQGGRLPEEWRTWLAEALDAGCDIWSGLHTFLADDPMLAAKARAAGRKLLDLRRPPPDLPIASGAAKGTAALRVLTVGTDCNVGKMTAQLQLVRSLNERGIRTRFVPTGQTGIMIEGDGLPIDCVVADFVSGAAEKMILQHQRSHDILLIEGQGSLVHPSYSGVTLSLLHGSAPQALILCYEVGREVVTGVESVKIPPLAEIKKIYDVMANIHQKCQCVGIGINGRKLNAEQAARERERIKAEFGLPACDVVRDGPDELVEAILAFRNKGGWESP